MRAATQIFSTLFSKCTSACKSLSKTNQERGYWSGNFGLSMSTIGCVVGLGNIWGFPYKCYSNGGGAFLIPYFILVAFVGLPMMFMEMAFGQYTNMGPVHGWKGCPIMTGVGWGMCFIAGSMSVYYNVLLAWCMYYLFASLTSKLPWSDCQNEWNDDLCTETGPNANLLGLQPCPEKVTVNCTRYESPSEQYFERVALGFVSYKGVHRRMSDPIGKLQWHIALCLLLCWIIVFCSLIRGIKTSGKVVYFTVLFPSATILLLMIRGLTLPGALSGLKILFAPDFTKLADSSMWTSAAGHMFFSLGVGAGGIPTLASYSRFNGNCYRDALIVVAADCVTSLICCVAVFSVLGYTSHRTGQPVSGVLKSGGTGVAFIMYTEALVTMPGGPAWSALFFALLLTLGIDSQFFTVEVVITAMLDQWPELRSNIGKGIGSIAAVCAVMFLLGLPMCCEGGIFVFEIISNYSSSFNVFVLALGEIVGICCFYGLDKFVADIKLMMGFKPGYYWILSWTVACPVLLVCIFIFAVVKYKSPTDANNETISHWGEAFGWGVMLMSLLIVLAFAVTWRPNVVGDIPSFDPLENRMFRTIQLRSEQEEQTSDRHSDSDIDEWRTDERRSTVLLE